jgi:hypothetical protein
MPAAASSRGVPEVVAALTSAPAAMRAETVSGQAFLAAKCSGVKPVSSRGEGGARGEAGGERCRRGRTGRRSAWGCVREVLLLRICSELKQKADVFVATPTRGSDDGIRAGAIGAGEGVVGGQERLELGGFAEGGSLDDPGFLGGRWLGLVGLAGGGEQGAAQ